MQQTCCRLLFLHHLAGVHLRDAWVTAAVEDAAHHGDRVGGLDYAKEQFLGLGLGPWVLIILVLVAIVGVVVARTYHCRGKDGDEGKTKTGDGKKAKADAAPKGAALGGSGGAVASARAGPHGRSGRPDSNTKQLLTAGSAPSPRANGEAFAPLECVDADGTSQFLNLEAPAVPSAPGAGPSTLLRLPPAPIAPLTAAAKADKVADTVELKAFTLSQVEEILEDKWGRDLTDARKRLFLASVILNRRDYKKRAPVPAACPAGSTTGAATIPIDRYVEVPFGVGTVGELRVVVLEWLRIASASPNGFSAGRRKRGINIAAAKTRSQAGSDQGVRPVPARESAAAAAPLLAGTDAEALAHLQQEEREYEERKLQYEAQLEVLRQVAGFDSDSDSSVSQSDTASERSAKLSGRAGLRENARAKDKNLPTMGESPGSTSSPRSKKHYKSRIQNRNLQVKYRNAIEESGFTVAYASDLRLALMFGAVTDPIPPCVTSVRAEVQEDHHPPQTVVVPSLQDLAACKLYGIYPGRDRLGLLVIWARRRRKEQRDVEKGDLEQAVVDVEEVFDLLDEAVGLKIVDRDDEQQRFHDEQLLAALAARGRERAETGEGSGSKTSGGPLAVLASVDLSEEEEQERVSRRSARLTSRRLALQPTAMQLDPDPARAARKRDVLLREFLAKTLTRAETVGILRAHTDFELPYVETLADKLTPKRAMLVPAAAIVSTTAPGSARASNIFSRQRETRVDGKTRESLSMQDFVRDSGLVQQLNPSLPRQSLSRTDLLRDSIEYAFRMSAREHLMQRVTQIERSRESSLGDRSSGQSTGQKEKLLQKNRAARKRIEVDGEAKGTRPSQELFTTYTPTLQALGSTNAHAADAVPTAMARATKFKSVSLPGAGELSSGASDHGDRTSGARKTATRLQRFSSRTPSQRAPSQRSGDHTTSSALVTEVVTPTVDSLAQEILAPPNQEEKEKLEAMGLTGRENMKRMKGWTYGVYLRTLIMTAKAERVEDPSLSPPTTCRKSGQSEKQQPPQPAFLRQKARHSSRSRFTLTRALFATGSWLPMAAAAAASPLPSKVSNGLQTTTVRRSPQSFVVEVTAQRLLPPETEDVDEGAIALAADAAASSFSRTTVDPMDGPLHQGETGGSGTSQGGTATARDDYTFVNDGRGRDHSDAEHDDDDPEDETVIVDRRGEEFGGTQEEGRDVSFTTEGRTASGATSSQEDHTMLSGRSTSPDSAAVVEGGRGGESPNVNAPQATTSQSENGNTSRRAGAGASSASSQRRLPVLLGTGKKLFECEVPAPPSDDQDRINALAKAKLAMLEHVCVRFDDDEEAHSQLCFEHGDAHLSAYVGGPGARTLDSQQYLSVMSESVRLVRDKSSFLKSADQEKVLSLKKRSALLAEILGTTFPSYGHMNVNTSSTPPAAETGTEAESPAKVSASAEDEDENPHLPNNATSEGGNATDGGPPFVDGYLMSEPQPPPVYPDDEDERTQNAAAATSLPAAPLQSSEGKKNATQAKPATGGTIKRLKTQFLPNVAVELKFPGNRTVVCECARPTEEAIRLLASTKSHHTKDSPGRMALVRAVAPDRIISPACCSYKGKAAPEDLLWPLLGDPAFSCSRYQPQQYKQIAGLQESELYTRSWWTTEFCLGPITQFHVTKDNQLHGSRINMGYLEPWTLTTTRNALLQTVEGGSCSSHFQVFTLSSMWLDAVFSEESRRAYGGTFNPLHIEGFEGRLVADVENNPFGCDEYKRKVQKGSIIVVKRGSCWFHEKALRAQNAGALGIIIANDDRPMADIMEGVDSLPAPRVMSVLVDRDLGQKLLDSAKANPFVRVKKYLDPEHGVERSLTSFVTLYCSPEWREPLCPKGTTVEVLVDDGGVGTTATFNAAGQTTSGGASWKRGVVEKELPDFEHLVVVHGKINAVEKVVSRSLVHRLPDFVSCAPSPVRLDHVEEPKNCQSNLKVHVAALCGHNSLLPQQRAKTEKIRCGLPAPRSTGWFSGDSAGRGQNAGRPGHHREEL
eukprot:g3378.t1